MANKMGEARTVATVKLYTPGNSSLSATSVEYVSRDDYDALAAENTELRQVLRLIAESRNLGVDPLDVEIVRAFIEEQGLRYKTVRREDGQQVVVSRTAEALDALARLSRADASQVAEWARKVVEK